MVLSDWLRENALFQGILRLWRRWRRVFLRLYTYAAVVYLPLIILRLTNYADGMWDQDDHLAGVAELTIGRWFWPYLDRLRFGVSLDPLPAIVSIALYVIGVLVLLNLMRHARDAAGCGCPTRRESSVPEKGGSVRAASAGELACQPGEGHTSSDNAAGREKDSSACAASAGELACRSGAEHKSSDAAAAPTGEEAPVRLTPVEAVAAAMALTAPALLCQLSYSYMSITLATGFLFAVLCVWVVAVCEASAGTGTSGGADSESSIPVPKPRRRLMRQLPWILLSALLIAMMMGLYQAFLGVLCLAALAYFIFLLEGPCGGEACCLKRAFRFVAGMFAALLLGGLLYEGLLWLHLTVLGQTLSSYNGADSISLGGILSSLPSSIVHCYHVFSFYFLKTSYRYNALQTIGKVYYLLYLAPLAGALLYAVRLARSDHGVVRVLLLAAAGVMIPVFASAYFLLATDSETMMQMTSGLGLVLPLMLLAWDRVTLPGTGMSRGRIRGDEDAEEDTLPGAAAVEKSLRKGTLQEGVSRETAPGIGKEAYASKERDSRGARLVTAAVSVVASLEVVLLLYGSIGQMEIDQYAMYAGRQATTTLANNVLNELAVYGVDYEYNVVLVYGTPAESPTFVVGDLYELANPYAQYGNWGNSSNTNRLCWYHFFKQQLRVKMNYAEGDTLEAVMASEEVAAMPVYPAAGSVSNIWGVTVVKIAE